MQTDLHDFLTHLARTVALTLVPVVLTAFLTLPFTLHGPGGDRPGNPHPPGEHMT